MSTDLTALCGLGVCGLVLSQCLSVSLLGVRVVSSVRFADSLVVSLFIWATDSLLLVVGLMDLAWRFVAIIFTLVAIVYSISAIFESVKIKLNL